MAASEPQEIKKSWLSNTAVVFLLLVVLTTGMAVMLRVIFEIQF